MNTDKTTPYRSRAHDPALLHLLNPQPSPLVKTTKTDLLLRLTDRTVTILIVALSAVLITIGIGLVARCLWTCLHIGWSAI